MFGLHPDILLSIERPWQHCKNDTLLLAFLLDAT